MRLLRSATLFRTSASAARASSYSQSYKTAQLAAASVILVLTLLSPSYAGYWSVSYAYSGQNTDSYTLSGTMHSDPPVDWSTSGSRNAISMGIPTSATSTNSAQVKCSGTVTATLTWVKDDKLPSDPAPPSV